MSRPVVAGAIGSSLVAAGGSLLTPLTSRQASTGRSIVGNLAFLAGAALLTAAWVWIVRARPQLRTVVVVTAIWSVPLLIAPPLASRDVHSYAAQGEMVARGLDPYRDPPLALRDREFLGRVDPLWRSTTVPYGPAWLAVAGGVVRASGHDPQRAVVGFRLVALAGVAVLGAATAALATDRAKALALVLANPLTLLHLVSGAHNEAWMVGLSVAGFAAARRRQPVAAVLLIGLAAGVKAPALALLAFAGWAYDERHRLRNAAVATFGGLAVLAALSAATGLGWGWLNSLGTPGLVRTALSPVTGLGVILGGITSGLGLVKTATTLGAVRAAGTVVMLALVAYLLLRSHRIGTLRAAGAAMLVAGFVNPAVHVWYALWGLPLLAATDEPPGPLLRLSAVLSLVLLPDGSSVLSWAKPLRYVLGAAVIGVAVAPLCRTIARS